MLQKWLQPWLCRHLICVWLTWGSLAGEREQLSGRIKKPKRLFLWHSCCLLSAKEWHLETGQSWREVCAFPGFAPCFWRVLSNLCSSCHLPRSILIIYGCFFSFSSSRMTFGMPNMLHAGLHLPAEVFKGNIWIYLAPGTYTAVIALI